MKTHQPQKIRLRPHHLLCTFCFEGKGYSPVFVRNYQKIADKLAQEPETKIEIIAETDDVCAPCPHRRGQLCETQEKIATLDANHSKMLNVKPGDVITWNTVLAKIKSKVTLADFHKACELCEWQALGICENKIKDFAS